MGLINKRFLLTLNQRVQGSSPCAPTTQLIENLPLSFNRLLREECGQDEKVPKRFQEWPARVNAPPLAQPLIVSRLKRDRFNLQAGDERPDELRRKQIPRPATGARTIGWVMGVTRLRILGVRSSNLCAPGYWQGVVGGSPTR